MWIWGAIDYNKVVLTALKRIAGVVILAGVLFAAVGPGVARAQETVSPGGVAITPEDIRTAIESPTPNLANTTAYIFYTISVIMTGTFRASQPTTVVTYRPSTLSEAISSRGLMGGMGFMTGELIRNRPASFEYYAADIASKSRFGATPAYAQGVGFGALTPILGTWNAFKNVAYYLLTIMFFITGFLILIRHKVSGNVAVTVQNALPRLVITLIVITFSYAIAGLVVDLMFLSLAFIINIFTSSIFNGNVPIGGTILGAQPATPTDIAYNMNIFSFMFQFIFNGGAYAAADSIGDVVTQAIGSIAQAFAPGNPLGSIMNFIIDQIFSIVFAVALFISMFRVFFQLLMAYAGFVLNVVLSPLILLEGAIPGRNPWTNWLKNLLAGLMPFVVVVFMIFMALALTGVEGVRDGIGYDKDNPGESGLRLPLILGQGINASAFLGILAMGFMLLLPEAVKITQQALGAKGGPFDQFRDKAIGALKEGISGKGAMPGAKALVPGTLAGAALAVPAMAGAGAVGLGTAGGRLFGERGAKIGRLVGAGVGGTVGLIAAPTVATAGAAVGLTAAAGASLYGTGKEYMQKLEKVPGGKTVVSVGKDIVGTRLDRYYGGGSHTAPPLPFDNIPPTPPSPAAPPRPATKPSTPGQAAPPTELI